MSLSNALFAQQGDLDNTFGTLGTVTTSVANAFVSGKALALQADGKILVAADLSSDGVRFKFALIRYTTSGSIDSTFGTNGLAIAAIDSFNDMANALAIQPGGQIIVAGFSSDSLDIDHFALVRFTQSGVLDTTFGTQGITRSNFGNVYAICNSIAIQPNGRIIAAGSATNDSTTQVAVARYTLNGILDSTFNGTGLVTTVVDSSDDEGYAVAIQPDGKLVVAGAAYNNDSSNYDFAVVRYDSTGVPDASFGNNGSVTTNLLGSGNFAYGVALQNNGQIVAAGRTFNSNTNAYMFGLVRYNSNGTLDNTFGAGGIDTTTIGGYDDEGQAVAIQPADGKIVVAGFADVNNTAYNFAVVRYNTNGSLDTTSNGGNGKVTTPVDSTSSGEAVAIQPDGKIVVAGYSQDTATLYYSVGVARYLTNLTLGIVDLAIANNSVFLYPNPLQNEAVLDYTLVSNEAISMYVYDVTGKLMQTVLTNETLSKGEHQQIINMRSLPAGIYFLTLANNNSQSIYIKIIKQ